MNPLFKTLQIPTEATKTVCPIHQISVMEIAGHKLCKLCAKETIHQSQIAYEAELQQCLLQQKIKNSGLNKRYLDCGFKNYVISCPPTRQCYPTMPSLCTTEYFKSASKPFAHRDTRYW